MILCAFLLFGGFLWLFGGLIRLFADKKFTEFGFVNGKKIKFKGENSKITELNSNKAEFQAKNSQNLKLKYTLTLIFTALCLVPFYQGFNIATLMYSFFDAPSVLCVLLMNFFVLKTLAKDFLNSALCEDFKSLTPLEKFVNLSINPISFVLLFVYGTIIFLGNLDLSPYDFYTLNALTQPYLNDLLLHEFNKIALVFVLLTLLYATSKLCAILALSSLLPFAFGTEQSMLTTLICPYLWAFSGIFIIIKILAFFKGKLCKKHF